MILRTAAQLQNRLSIFFVLGCGSYLAWFYIVFLQMFTPTAFKTGSLSIVQMLPGLSAVAVMVGCALLSEKVAPLSRHLKLTIGVGASSLLGVWGSFLAQNEVIVSVGGFALGAVAFGIGFGWITLLWVELMGRLDAVRAFRLWGLAIVVGSTACIGLWLLDGDAAVWASLLVPGLAVIFATLAVATVNKIVSCEGVFSRSGEELKRFPWGIMPVLAIYAFVFGLSRSALSSVPNELMGQAAAGVVLALVCPLLLARGRLSSLGRAIMPCVVAGLLCVALLGPTVPIVQLFVNGGFGILVSGYALFIADFSGRLESPSIRIAGLTYAAVFVVVSLGSLAGDLACLLPLPSQVETSIAICSALILVIASVAWPNAYDPAVVLGGGLFVDRSLQTEAESTDQILTFYDEMRVRCAKIAEKYALSSREQEVLEQLAAGKSIVRTASALYVSQATIKTHVHHIYKKMNIHSRDELRDVLDGWRDA